MPRPKPDPKTKAAGLAASQKKYRQTAAGKATAIRGQQKQTTLNYHKVHARWILNNAIKVGRVTSQPCIFCLTPKAEAHHYDYDKPLAVLWMCRPCHKSFHKLQNP